MDTTHENQEFNVTVRYDNTGKQSPRWKFYLQKLIEQLSSGHSLQTCINPKS